MALAEGPAAAAAPPATDCDAVSSRGLAAASSAQSRAACSLPGRGAREKFEIGVVQRLERSLTEVGPSDPLRAFEVVGKLVSAVVATSGGGLKGDCVRALKSGAATLEERLREVVDRTTTTETAGLRQEVALQHARLEQLSNENGKLRAENGQLRVDMAELRTMVADLIERQRSSAPAPPPPEAEGLSEVDELRRQLLIQEARSSKVERARPPLAHEANGSTPVPAPRRSVQPAVKAYSGKKKATPARTPAAAAPKPAAAGAPAPTAPASKPVSAPAPSQPAKAGPGRSRNKKKGRTNAAKPAPTPQPRPLPPAPANMDEAWTTVVRRGPKKVAAPVVPRPKPAPTAAAPRQEGRAEPRGRTGRRRPRAPRSAAAVVELLPAAKERGITYHDVMTQARGGVNVDALGVEDS
ncbi:uncharacterized protein LOC114242317 [Bombyx mandarina]|uniref:Uncharacterized protein LOC114242317 n=1 Tax=Bombyx mandarina TaxID=7092 RepID=A0A6J2JI46_BOMMA|nr:uncharacterized protein LOC114242317 [Bombyx mandarina]